LQPGEGGGGEGSNTDGSSSQSGVSSISLEEHFYAADSEHFQIWSEHPAVNSYGNELYFLDEIPFHASFRALLKPCFVLLSLYDSFI